MATKTLLLAAAADDILKALGEEIAQTSFSPLATRSWASVLEHLAPYPLSGAIVHFQLEDISGIEFCHLLRQQPGREDIPIILLTPELASEAEPEDPFDIIMRFPSGPGVLADQIVHMIHKRTFEASEATQALRTELEGNIQNAQNKSYYQLLGLRVTASRAEVTKAYDSFSVRFHPDQLKKHQNEPDLVDMAQRYYLLVCEAYQVLIKPGTRIRYDAGLEKGQLRYVYTEAHKIVDLPSLTKVPNAKRYLRLAQQEMSKRDRKSALTFFEMALAVDPTNGEILRLVTELKR